MFDSYAVTAHLLDAGHPLTSMASARSSADSLLTIEYCKEVQSPDSPFGGLMNAEMSPAAAIVRYYDKRRLVFSGA